MLNNMNMNETSIWTKATSHYLSLPAFNSNIATAYTAYCNDVQRS